MESKTKVALKWSAITEVLAKLISPIVNIVLARLLTPDAFGAVATITMVITFAEVFSDAGFQKYIIQHEFDSENELDNASSVAFWTNLILSILITAIIFFARNSISRIVGTVELGSAIGVYSIVIVLVASSSIQIARLRRSFDFKTLFLARIISSSIPLVVTIPLAFILRSYWALVLGSISTTFVNSIIIIAKSKWKPSLWFEFDVLKKMFSFASWTLVEAIVIWLTTNVDIFIVGTILSDYFLGIYKTTMTTISSYFGLITAAILPVLFSALSRYQDDKMQFDKTFLSFQKYTGVFVIPMSVGVYVYSDLITYILLGDQWMEASRFVGLWGLMSGITILFSYFASEVFRSQGKPKLSAISQIIHIAMLVPVVLLSVKKGFDTLCLYRTIVRFPIVSIILLVTVCKMSVLKMIANLLPTIISTFAMGLLGKMFVVYFDNYLLQFVSIGVCAIIYFVVLITCFPKTRRELLALPIVSKILSKIRKKDR